MTIRLTPPRKTGSAGFRRCAAISILFYAPVGAAAQTNAAREPQAIVSGDERYCANVAASVETLRLERRRKQLAELESAILARLQALETRQNELRILLERLDAFERKAGGALTGLYSAMKPELAAAQLAQLDDDVAAGVMLQLKTKISSAILGEMEAARGAALAKKIAELRSATDGRKP